MEEFTSKYKLLRLLLHYHYITVKIINNLFFYDNNYTFREYYPQNIMIDKRVVRGSTHAAMVIPAGTYPDALFNGTGKK